MSRSTSSARIALPLAMLFGTDALAYRLQNSGAKALITNAQGLAKLAQSAARLPDLELVLSVDGAGDGALGFRADAARAPRPISRRCDTSADDPAMMIYTSGTTGQPKGALHAHRVLLGHLPGIEIAARVLPAAGRPLLDAGRLGLGRRPARRACCRACITACRWWRAGSTSSIRRRPSR